MNAEDLRKITTQFAEATDSDVLIYTGPVEPNRTEIELIEAFENLVLDPSSESMIGYVSSPKEELNNENGDKGRSGETSDTDSGKSSGIKKVAK